jgi:hypothetical protein
VDPYEPNTIYVLDADGVKVSVDGGRSWDLDARFTRVITADGKLTTSASLLQDMLFTRGERQTRFASGAAGVFWTDNFGVEWLPIVNSIALPGRPSLHSSIRCQIPRTAPCTSNAKAGAFFGWGASRGRRHSSRRPRSI